MTEDIERKSREAGAKAVQFRKAGFHCSESVFLAINDTLKITDPSMVRIATGFHGGGGTRRKDPEINLNACLEEIASGRDKRPPEELPLMQIGHLCGALASGIICIGLLYGRKGPTDDLTCIDELCFELQSRFMEEFGERECRPLRRKWVPLSLNHTCENVYKGGAELAVELILSSEEIVPECGKTF